MFCEAIQFNKDILCSSDELLYTFIRKTINFLKLEYFF